MDSPSRPRDSMAAAACCACDCRRCCSPAAWQRTVKRKLDEMEEDVGVGLHGDVAARVGVENEVMALREALASHQQSIQELCVELEEERNASSSAASEAMSMILRLQREKAEVQMEARQFKRFAEEKMAHDQQELLALEDFLYKRDQAVQSLSCEVQAYRHRFLSYGIHPESEAEAARGRGGGADDIDNDGDGSARSVFFDYPEYDYPPLRCYDHHHLDQSNGDDEGENLEKYTLGETPRAREHLKNIKHRIYQLERTPSSTHVNVMEKGVVVGQSTRHSRRFSSDSLGSYLSREPECNGKQHEDFPVMVDRPSDCGEDDMTDRVYTVDAVHRAPQPAPGIGVCEDYSSTPRDSVCRADGGGGGGEEADIKKLYMRLQVLEADRESMRQAIISMRTDKAQLVLLKEIAQHLCRGPSPPPPPPPERRIVKKPSFLGSFSLVSMVKWIVSFVFWKKKAHRSKYMFGPSNNNVGLLLLLDKSPRMRQWRCLTRV